MRVLSHSEMLNIDGHKFISCDFHKSSSLNQVDQYNQNLSILLLGMVCTGFPGPGDEATIIANPMQEFIEPEGRNIMHSVFDNFLKKHPKDYTDKQEYHHRRETFRQNLRYIIIIYFATIYDRKRSNKYDFIFMHFLLDLFIPKTVNMLAFIWQ